MKENILTTIPHYFCCFIAPSYNYSYLVFVASSLSVLHHIYEKNKFIHSIDLFVAGIWATVDFSMNKYTLILNLITAFLYLKVYHPYWHLISVFKSIVVIKYFYLY